MCEMNNSTIELHRRIDEILYYKWDPIGVNYTAATRDEYYSYTPEIAKIAEGENCIENLTTHLNNIQVVSMGLGSNLEKCKEIAEYIYEWCVFLGFQKAD